jgi:hypothetical protein
METSGSITDDNLMASDSKVIGCALVWWDSHLIWRGYF